MSDWWVQFIATLIAAATACLVIFLTFVLLRKAYHVLRRICQATLQGVTPWVLLISFLLSLLAFPQIFRHIFRTFSHFILLIFDDFPAAVFGSARRYFTNCVDAPSGGSNCALDALGPLAQFWDNQFAEFLQEAFSLRIYSILLWISLFFALVFIFHYVFPIVIDSLVSAGKRWNAEHKRKSTASAAPEFTTGQILFLGFALTISLYLVLTAIVATPIFEQSAPDMQATRDRLKQSMEEFSNGSPPSFEETPPRIKTNQSLLADLHLKMISVNKGKYGESSVQYVVTDAFNRMEAPLSTYTDLARQLSKRWKDFPQLMTEYQIRLVGHFEQSNRGRIGGRQTDEHADAIAAHYRVWVSEAASVGRRCYGDIDAAMAVLNEDMRRLQALYSSLEMAHSSEESLDEVLQAISTHGVGRKTGGRTINQPPVWNGPRAVREELAPPQISYFGISPFYEDPCNTELTGILRLPVRSSLEGTLGIFGIAGGWLLQTESRDLALITGMIGFGLFGALGASFIRTSNAAGGLSFPSHSALAGVFVRGISAAVLIYLVVVGGLAVFAKENPTPNSYAVFFACFVAAVFSEDVWEWARKKQQARLTDSGPSTPSNS